MYRLSVVPQETSDSRTLGRKVYIRCFFNLNLFKVCVCVCVCICVCVYVCVCVCSWSSTRSVPPLSSGKQTVRVSSLYFSRRKLIVTEIYSRSLSLCFVSLCYPPCEVVSPKLIFSRLLSYNDTGVYN